MSEAPYAYKRALSRIDIFAMRRAKNKRNLARAMQLTGYVRRDELAMPDGMLEVSEIAESIKPLLSGRPPELVGAVLADLVSLWVAGHVVFGDAEATGEWRQARFDQWIGMTRDMLASNIAMVDQPARKQ